MKKDPRAKDHFAVASSVNWPLIGSEAGGDRFVM